ncbi:unnamed protein product [Parascedosporium putredinis]|uniref:Uncharacterized protein n=1 Tax=Parascedosporium putredinis TaxID=1442378 RepID=A0A9P1H743_9PEZI|nr:unnamed protein product [Parascedosporium putredinis]CAI7999501.1 unnamed protein product [Parascedosporium putredinis]
MAEEEIRDASVEDDGDAAMQAMLGFSAFGAQNPKKRKFSGTVVGAPTASAAQDGVPSAGLPPRRRACRPARPRRRRRRQGAPRSKASSAGTDTDTDTDTGINTLTARTSRGASRRGSTEPAGRIRGEEARPRRKGTWLAKAHRHPKD